VYVHPSLSFPFLVAITDTKQSNGMEQSQVDDILFRLYEPILWRSLKVANPMVRRNSALLLVDAFPLQDPETSNEEMDALLQKQFDAIQTMIQDPCSAVRQVGIEGICHIFARFWELVPVSVLNDFLNQLVNDLAFDARSSFFSLFHI